MSLREAGLQLEVTDPPRQRKSPADSGTAPLLPNPGRQSLPSVGLGLLEPPLSEVGSLVTTNPSPRPLPHT